MFDFSGYFYYRLNRNYIRIENNTGETLLSVFDILTQKLIRLYVIIISKTFVKIKVEGSKTEPIQVKTVLRLSIIDSF